METLTFPPDLENTLKELRSALNVSLHTFEDGKTIRIAETWNIQHIFLGRQELYASISCARKNILVYYFPKSDAFKIVLRRFTKAPAS